LIHPGQNFCWTGGRFPAGLDNLFARGLATQDIRRTVIASASAMCAKGQIVSFLR